MEKTYVFDNNERNCADNWLPYLLMNNGGMYGANGGAFWWIIVLFFLWGRNGWGNEGNNGTRGTEFLASLMNNDKASDLLMQAISGNSDKLNSLATTLNCDVNSLNNAICQVQSAIQGVSNQIGMSGQQIINAVQSGNCDIKTQLAECCCGIKDSITRQGYENQLANERQTYALTNSINNVAVGQERGFSSVAYAQQAQTCALQQTANDNTRAILAKLDAIEDSRKDREIAALTAKNASLIARAERQAELAPIYKSLSEIECKQPATVTLPYSCATAVPTALACQLGYGFPYGFTNGFNNAF